MSAGFDASRARPSIEIVIDQHYSSKVYTTGSNITGHARIKSFRDVSFDSFEISFIGTAATRLDYVQSFPSHSCRTFMKLRMPILSSSLPNPRVFAAGQTYTVPFNFVVPRQLTIGACNHKCTSLAVREQHLRLPPTVGFWESNDQAPEMVRIQYAIKARAIEHTAGGAEIVLGGQHILKVLPATPEDAPLDITSNDQRYNLSKTKTIRKSLFAGKLGKITASSIQPCALMLSPDGHRASSTVAHVDLEFAPSSLDAAPPKINSVTGKLTATTFFSGLPVENLPNLGGRISYAYGPALNYSTSTNLFSVGVEKPAWHQQRTSSARRDSGYSSSHFEEEACDSDASGRRGSRGRNAKKEQAVPFTHVTSLDIPITVPITNKKFFLPTFHSCLMSRTYTLQLNLSVGPTNTAVSLSIPLQIGVEAVHSPQAEDELPSFETAMAQAAEAEADEFLQPRVMHIPPEETLGTSLLPGYEHRGAAISVS